MADGRAVSRPERRSPRLRGYDYRQPGLYFVTVVTADRQLAFGDIQNHEMVLSTIGELAKTCWVEIPSHHTGVELDAFVVMPNHVHGLIALTGAGGDSLNVGAYPRTDDARRDRACPVPTPRPDRSEGVSLSTVVGSYKSAVTRLTNQHNGTPGASLWQPRFHDRIVRLRDPDELATIRRYIAENPARWPEDREYSSS